MMDVERACILYLLRKGAKIKIIALQCSLQGILKEELQLPYNYEA